MLTLLWLSITPLLYYYCFLVEYEYSYRYRVLILVRVKVRSIAWYKIPVPVRYSYYQTSRIQVPVTYTAYLYWYVRGRTVLVLHLSVRNKAPTGWPIRTGSVQYIIRGVCTRTSTGTWVRGPQNDSTDSYCTGIYRVQVRSVQYGTT